VLANKYSENRFVAAAAAVVSLPWLKKQKNMYALAPAVLSALYYSIVFSVTVQVSYTTTVSTAHHTASLERTL
jgi:hypothetical protein